MKTPAKKIAALTPLAFGKLRDKDLSADCEGLSAKERLDLALKLEKWAKELRLSVGLTVVTVSEINPDESREYTEDQARVVSVFIIKPKFKTYGIAALSRLAAKLKHWSKELELEIDRRTSELTIGNPQN